MRHPLTILSTMPLCDAANLRPFPKGKSQMPLNANSWVLLFESIAYRRLSSPLIHDGPAQHVSEYSLLNVQDKVQFMLPRLCEFMRFWNLSCSASDRNVALERLLSLMPPHA